MAEDDTRRDPPVWPPRIGRPRVLVEAGDDGWRRTTLAALRDGGYEVIGCEGPRPDHDEPCPAVDGGRCPGAAHADVVLCVFDAGHHQTRDLPGAVAHELREGASVLVLVGPEDAGRYASELEECRILDPDIGTEDLLAVVATAVEELERTPAPRSGRSRPVVWTRPPDR